MITVIFMGSYAAQNYVWNVGYQIVPLSKIKVVVDLEAHSGATNVSTSYCGGSESAPAVNVTVPASKTLNIYVFIPASILDNLEHDFYSIRLTVGWKQMPYGTPHTWGPINLVSGGLRYGKHAGETLIYESNIGLYGILVGMNGAVRPTIEGAPSSSTWGFWFRVDGIWTGAVQTPTGPASFPIWVYAVEV
jgi:hypothetical protein